MAFVQTRLRNTAHQDHSSSNRPQLRLTPAAAALCMLFVALHAPAAESTLWPQQGGSEANPLVLDGPVIWLRAMPRAAGTASKTTLPSRGNLTLTAQK